MSAEESVRALEKEPLARRRKVLKAAAALAALGMGRPRWMDCTADASAGLKSSGQASGELYIMPLWEEGLDVPAIWHAEGAKQIAKLKKQLGSGNRYNRLGFASIYAAGNLELLENQLKVMQQHQVHRGVIFAMQTHNNGLVNPDADLRNYQWRLDGKTWAGMPGTHRGRDALVVTPSRYATAVRLEMARKAAAWAADVKRASSAYPGIIAAINFVIEEELAIGGSVNTKYLGDYSPFAIAEFRDWLRHRGMYAPGGAYSGQGAWEPIVGALVRRHGRLVSRFYDHPSPDRASDGGPSFNETFGTRFKTWTLAYWDPVQFPKPITDKAFNPSPRSGPGFTNGGFDAPRVINHSRWWHAWDWTYQDNHNHFPPGNPRHPAYGFRQVLVANFVRDLGDMLINNGLDSKLLYPHQIPAECLGDAPAGRMRALSSASTIWSGYLPQNGHLGITRFGTLDTSLVTQYSRNWGIFEWHPAPNTPAHSPALYNAATRDLKKFVSHGCRLLFPGWWHVDRVGKTFPLNDSAFAKAIKDFLAKQPDHPHQSVGGL